MARKKNNSGQPPKPPQSPQPHHPPQPLGSPSRDSGSPFDREIPDHIMIEVHPHGIITMDDVAEQIVSQWSVTKHQVKHYHAVGQATPSVWLAFRGRLTKLAESRPNSAGYLDLVFMREDDELGELQMTVGNDGSDGGDCDGCDDNDSQDI